MAKKSPQTKAKQAVKKAAKKNPKGLIIAIIAIVLIIAIAVAVVYFAFPNTWNNIISSISQISNKDNGSSSSSDQNGGNGDLKQGEGELKVHYIDVGQGDCIYIQFPDGKDMLIDCGNKSSGFNFKTDVLDYINPINTDKTLDYLMLTHCDEDHVDSLDLIVEEYQVNNIYMPNVLATPTNAKLKEKVDALDTSMFTDPDTISTACYAEFFIAALTEPNCTVKLNVDPDDDHQSIQIIEETYSLIFYCPTQETWDKHKLNSAHDKNAISPIGILTYNNKRIVLTGDSNEEDWSEGAFIKRAGKIDCDVLKVGHHGSETSTTSALLNNITCEYAVISCNYYGNTFGHPRQAAIDRMVALNMTIYRTDLNGNIVTIVDKNGNITFSTEHSATKAQLENGLTNEDLAAIDEIKTKQKNGTISETEMNQQIKDIVGY